jgi:hypothetical protein
MQIGLGENDMPGHNETDWEADSKCYHPGAHFRGNLEATIYMGYLFMKYEIDGNVLHKNVQHGIRSATGEITESLSGYPTGEWPMKEINNSYYDMSGYPKQVFKIDHKDKER